MLPYDCRLTFNSPLLTTLFILAAFVIGVNLAYNLFGQPKQKGKSARTRQKSQRSIKASTKRSMMSKKITALSGFEFERLLASYFRDQGYVVEEVGGGGADGGVDLILKDWFISKGVSTEWNLR